MLYQSTTTWGFDWRNLPGWEIEIRFGEFNSVEQAAKCGESMQWLCHTLGCNYLELCELHGNIHVVRSPNITVRQQKLETFGKLMLNPVEDFVVVELQANEVCILPASFCSLAYGIIDINGERVKFPFPKHSTASTKHAELPAVAPGIKN